MFECTQKIKDKNNHIVMYLLQGMFGVPKLVKAEELKEALIHGKTEISNLTLTSDNRIVDKKSSKQGSTPLTTKIIASFKILKRSVYIAEAVGPKPTYFVYTMFCDNHVFYKADTLAEIDTDCGHKIYFAHDLRHSINGTQDTYNLYIPENVKYVHSQSKVDTSTKAISDIREIYKIRVFGGSGLIATNYLFAGCTIFSLDLSLFDTHNVQNMEGMFKDSEICNIIGTSKGNDRGIDTSKVVNMNKMFYSSRIDGLDLTAFNTSNVKSMNSMFELARIYYLDITSFSTNSIENKLGRHQIEKIFYGADIANIDVKDPIIVNAIHKKY